MELVCTNCHKSYNINPAESASAAIDYTFGKKTHIFKCDHCGKDNTVSKETFNAAKEAEKNPKPIAQPIAKPAAKPAVTPIAKPFAKPDLAPVMKPAAKRTAVVTTRSLHVRKDHSTSSETMAGLKKGDKVEVLSTWTDGKNTWIQIGPDRWAAMEYSGDKLMEYE